MATNWYDPNGAGSGFFNSPQDFLFKSQGGTWYGQGPAGQNDASRMPTMGDYYFGGGQQQPATDPLAYAKSLPLASGGPTTPEGYNPGTPARLGGGGHINLGNNVSVPQGPLWQRYQALQANPAMIEADPAYRYMLEQGEEALGRSAGARRKRFAGQTMLDFQKHAQGQAAGYLRQLLPELRAGAGQEYRMAENEAQAGAQQRGMEAIAADPYGHARNLATKYRSLNEFQSSPEYAQMARAGQGNQAVQRYLLGERLRG